MVKALTNQTGKLCPKWQRYPTGVRRVDSEIMPELFLLVHIRLLE